MALAFTRQAEISTTDVGTELSEWDLSINRGVLTGFNKAFIVDNATKANILHDCSSDVEKLETEKLFKRIIRGKDIKRNSFKWAGLWLINLHNGLKKRIPKVDVNSYPALKAFLDQYIDDLNARTDKGDTPYNLRNCAYLEDFDKPKVIYPETTQGAYFIYDEEGLYIDKTCFMLNSPYAKYLQSTLSSKLFEFAYKRIFSSIELGAKGYQYNKHALLKLPVIPQTIADIKEDTIIDDNFIFNLYGISEDERNFIEETLDTK